MQLANFVRSACVLVACGCVATPLAPSAPEPTSAVQTTPLILEKNEGERRVMRGWPGHPSPGETFILKIDPKNGGSSHLVFLTVDLAPGKVIETHKHVNADEIVFLQAGTARVRVGDYERVVHSGSTVFIPAGTWISVSNIGNDVMSLVGIFSAPGFEDLMRDASVREGEKNLPMSKAENDKLEKKYSHLVNYKEP